MKTYRLDLAMINKDTMTDVFLQESDDRAIEDVIELIESRFNKKNAVTLALLSSISGSGFVGSFETKIAYFYVDDKTITTDRC